MSKRQMYETQTEHWITPILERNNFELVDVEYVKEGSTWYLRAYIDKEGGITVDDCEIVAREMNEILDREDYIEDSYVFELLRYHRHNRLKLRKILCCRSWNDRYGSLILFPYCEYNLFPF